MSIDRFARSYRPAAITSDFYSGSRSLRGEKALRADRRRHGDWKRKHARRRVASLLLLLAQLNRRARFRDAHDDNGEIRGNNRIDATGALASAVLFAAPSCACQCGSSARFSTRVHELPSDRAQRRLRRFTVASRSVSPSQGPSRARSF